ncbi:MAG: hypothetical protein R2728_10620 [Chitinophagales bacterium]
MKRISIFLIVAVITVTFPFELDMHDLGKFLTQLPVKNITSINQLVSQN